MRFVLSHPNTDLRRAQALRLEFRRAGSMRVALGANRCRRLFGPARSQSADLLLLAQDADAPPMGMVLFAGMVLFCPAALQPVTPLDRRLGSMVAHSLSPGLSFRCEAMARSVAALAP